MALRNYAMTPYTKFLLYNIIYKNIIICNILLYHIINENVGNQFKINSWFQSPWAYTKEFQYLQHQMLSEGPKIYPLHCFYISVHD